MSVLKPPLGSLILPGHPINRGLVGCWLLNEGSGNTAYDLSGNGNHGVVNTYCSWTHDGVDFGGDPDSDLNLGGITIPNSPTLIGMSDLTVLVWGRRYAATVGSSSVEYLVGSLGSGDDNYSLHWNQTEEIAFAVYDAPDDVQVRIDYDTIPTDTTLMGGTFVSGGAMKLYLHGVLIGETTQTGPVNSHAHDIVIGNSLAGVANGWYGVISQVMIWRRALSPSEIASLYADPYMGFRRQRIGLWSSATQGGGAPPAAAGYMTLNTGYWG